MSSTNVEYAEGIYLDDGTLKKFKDADLTKQVEELNSNLIHRAYPLSLTVPANSTAHTSIKIDDIDGYNTSSIMFRRTDSGSWAIVTSLQDAGATIIVTADSKATSSNTLTGEIRVTYRKIRA